MNKLGHACTKTRAAVRSLIKLGFIIFKNDNLTAIKFCKTLLSGANL
jgi:hypothetical protein